MALHWNKIEPYLPDTVRSHALLSQESGSFRILGAGPGGVRKGMVGWGGARAQQNRFIPPSAFLSLTTFSLPDTAPELSNLRSALL